MTRAEQLQDLHNSLSRIWSPDNFDYRYVMEVLQQREQLLQSAHPYFRDAANRVVKIVTQRANGVVQGAALNLEVDGAVRGELVALLNNVPQPLKDLWLGLPSGTDRYERLLQLSQVFYWSLSRMIQFGIDGDSAKVPNIEVKHRGTVDGEPAPYALHTCVDVPFAVSKILGLRSIDPWSASMQLALEWVHDTKEVGQQLEWVEGRFTDGVIVLGELDAQLPLRRLGQKLAIGTELVTESEFEEIYNFDPAAYDDFEKSVNSRIERCIADYQLDSCQWITKILLRDPLVFGGLALQISSGTKSLCEYDSSARASGLKVAAARNLAQTICTTEAGDRVADMATLERHIEQHKNDLGLMRFKILAYCSRMLNMYEKLVEANEYLDPQFQPLMQRALRTYLAVLAVKFDQMNLEIPDGAKRIKREELLRFYDNIFVPIQTAADLVTQPFVDKKISSVLKGSSHTSPEASD